MENKRRNLKIGQKFYKTEKKYLKGIQKNFKDLKVFKRILKNSTNLSEFKSIQRNSREFRRSKKVLVYKKNLLKFTSIFLNTHELP